MFLSSFDYALPSNLIADVPSNKREDSRLLVVEEELKDLKFNDVLNYISEEDLIIFNDTKVIKARLEGHKKSGGKLEILVEKILNKTEVYALIRSNKLIKIGLEICLPNELKAIVIEKLDVLFKLKLVDNEINFYDYLEKYGELPIPRYMNRKANSSDLERYQTIYSKNLGSIAAPTAGLHFTQFILNKILERGAKIAYLTLHVGSGTFKPVRENNILIHKMHSEVYCISQETIDLIKCSTKNSRKIIAVGTTTLRALEDAALKGMNSGISETNIFIYPGFKFKVVDKLITNFHLPKSTLLMLVSAFSGANEIKRAYLHAIEKCYRFYSYGDAMLLNLKNE